MSDKKPAGGDASNLKTVTVSTAMGEATFRAMTRAESKRWVNMSLGPEKVEAYEGMSRACVVSPDLDTFDKWIADKPMIVIPCAQHIQELSGVIGALVEKK